MYGVLLLLIAGSCAGIYLVLPDGGFRHVPAGERIMLTDDAPANASLTPAPNKSTTQPDAAQAGETARYGWIVPYGAALMDAPNPEGTQLCYLESLEQVEVLERQAQWLLVEAGGQRGYVLKDQAALALENALGYVGADQVDLVDRPEGDAQAITQLALGTQVTLLAQLDAHWYLVLADERQGCMAGVLIEQQKPEIPGSTAQAMQAAFEAGRHDATAAATLLEQGAFDDGADLLLRAAYQYRTAARTYLAGVDNQSDPAFLLELKAQWVIDTYAVYLKTNLANEQLALEDTHLLNTLTQYGQDMIFYASCLS